MEYFIVFLCTHILFFYLFPTTFPVWAVTFSFDGAVRSVRPSLSIVSGGVFGSFFGRLLAHRFRAGVSVLPSRTGRPGTAGCGAALLIDFDVPLMIVFVLFEGGRPIHASTCMTHVFQRRKNPGHHAF